MSYSQELLADIASWDPKKVQEWVLLFAQGDLLRAEPPLPSPHWIREELPHRSFQELFFAEHPDSNITSKARMALLDAVYLLPGQLNLSDTSGYAIFQLLNFAEITDNMEALNVFENKLSGVTHIGYDWPGEMRVFKARIVRRASVPH